MTMGLTYFRRFRMEIDLRTPARPLPPLPSGYLTFPWDPGLLTVHAETKYQCFRDEMDSKVFPCLGQREGCLRLMTEIARKPGFVPGATWLMSFRRGPGDVDFCGTVQGLSDPTGFGAIQNLGVTPAHRGLGLGTHLLLRALDGFRQARLPFAFLEVTADNDGAIRLYQRLGFSIVRTLFKVSTPA